LRNPSGMGVLCSSVDIREGEEDVIPDESKAQNQSLKSFHRRLRKMPLVMASEDSQSNWRRTVANLDFEDVDDYNKALSTLQFAEKAIAFDAQTTAGSSDTERKAAILVRKLKAYDWDHTYALVRDKHGAKRSQGEHFLGNVDLINTTELFKVAKRMPKGAHLHIHFNSCLPARFLIQQARNIDAMYIRSTLPLTTPENWAASRISFMVMTPYEATHEKDADGNERFTKLGNVWDLEYVPNRWMPYKEFQKNFEFIDERGYILRCTEGAERWLERKMEISEEEAHNTYQTGRG
jgi:adenosine deaminase CECR1